MSDEAKAALAEQVGRIGTRLAEMTEDEPAMAALFDSYGFRPEDAGAVFKARAMEHVAEMTLKLMEIASEENVDPDRLAADATLNALSYTVTTFVLGIEVGKEIAANAE